MCGIVGILGPGRPAMLEPAAQRMIQAQTHRGPDDEGLVNLASSDTGWNMLLGCRRLAIIDLSSEGHQPMGNEDGTVWVAHNGEIYNFETLREHLMSKGHRFRSRTDTEVILRLYEEYGEDSIARLTGMFAIAIWDHRKGRLLLARDRLGEKPLYYTWDGDRFLFASEVKALLASGLVPRRTDPAAVEAYLTLGSVPSPLTIIEGIRSLEPGSLMDVRGGKTTTRRYWDLVFEEDNKLRRDELPEMLKGHLQSAISSRLTSDVPMGVFLSGGLDSSTIVSMMRQTVTGRLQTYSIRFEQPEFDEGHFARLVADRFETEHTEYLMTAGEVWNNLDLIVEAMDQPSVDGVNIYFVSKLARSCGTVVAHSGLGGDELFGGYSSFWLAPRLRRIGRVLEGIYGGRKAARASIGWLPKKRKLQRLRSFLGKAPSSESAYLTLRGLFLDESLEKLLADGSTHRTMAWNPLEYLNSISSGYSESIGNRISRLELGTYLNNTLLRDADTMSMAHSLEVRAPFLDHTLVEFLSRVPSKYKFGGRPKRLLIKATKDLLPSEITNRSKGAFSFPFDSWIRKDWRPSFEALLLEKNHNSIELFDYNGVRELWRSFLEKRARWSQVWAVLVLQMWIRCHIDGAGGPELTNYHIPN